MVKKSELRSEVDSAKLEYMKIRFRTVLGESVNSSVVKAAKKKISNAVRAADFAKNKRG